MNPSTVIRCARLIVPMALVFVVFPAFAADDDSSKWEDSLWSSNASCTDEKATFLAIESNGKAYKLALCESLGCRRPVPGFGKKIQEIDFKKDPRLTWVSNTAFDLSINGVTSRFHYCKVASLRSGS